MFARFADLFQNKCKAQGIYIREDNGEYSTAFKLWCKKLDEAGLNVDDIARGIKHLEEHIRDSVRTGNEVWPPSYAEFIGHCEKQRERELHKPYIGLPRSVMTDEERKEKMNKLRGSLKI